MTLAPISSYGSISTFQDYVSDIDEEMGDEPEEFQQFRKLTMKVRGISENCRRQAFLVVILLTFLVILFGISATDDSPKVASNLCRQLLAFVTPTTAQVEN